MALGQSILMFWSSSRCVALTGGPNRSDAMQGRPGQKLRRVGYEMLTATRKVLTVPNYNIRSHSTLLQSSWITSLRHTRDDNSTKPHEAQHRSAPETLPFPPNTHTSVRHFSCLIQSAPPLFVRFLSHVRAFCLDHQHFGRLDPGCQSSQEHRIRILALGTEPYWHVEH
ncbi:uncharacterized protein J3D65DRAFT_104228 [Phyllosticta citribraziliensis]|uniref:Secreted protein n=1 Tax=Phyllosticta citribraziliensis TaxID=989973 RepID=A0ABR1LAY1_9PEZI